MKELPERKHPRLKQYDYSEPGYYYVTIHMQKECPLLSTVGRGLAPAECKISLSLLGRVIEKQLLDMQIRYPHVVIDRYVIMPTHIHAIIKFESRTGASPRPALMSVVGAFKSLTTRQYNEMQNTPGRKLFQTSFYETVLRNESAYVACCRYIDENPLKWLLTAEEK